MEMLLLRTPQGFIPATDAESDKIRKVKLGATIRAEVSQPRNYQFLKKWMVLATLAFDMWSETVEPREYKGVPVEPNFERFRKDLVILCGYFTPVYNVRGECRLEADSISFAKMDEETFEQLYSQTITAILKHILPNAGLSEESLRMMTDEVVRFG